MEETLRQRIDALPKAARAELLHVLLLPDFERADRIGSYYGNRRAPAVRKPDTWSAAPRLSPLARRRDCDRIVTRHHWPFPTQGHTWMSIGREPECQAGVVDRRPVPRSGKRLRRRIHAPGPRQRNHRGAIALVEHGALDWDCSRGRPTCAGADPGRGARLARSSCWAALCGWGRQPLGTPGRMTPVFSGTYIVLSGPGTPTGRLFV
jgi:hypothetical protein